MLTLHKLKLYIHFNIIYLGLMIGRLLEAIGSEKCGKFICSLHVGAPCIIR